MPTELPIFGICGRHESGKTTLIEALLPELHAGGLSVAVAKIHASVIDVDRAGKDSDRLFRAGADVFLEGRDEAFARTRPAPERPVSLALDDLARRYDLVIVEGRKRFEGTRVWLLGEGESVPAPEAEGALAVLPRDVDRLDALRGILKGWLPRQWLRPPVYACILIGGKSRRMGAPKHLLRRGGRTWLERSAEILGSACERVAVVGAGEIPGPMKDAVRLPDAPDAEGPLAGILSAMRWAPWASWIVSACDLPNASKEAVEWLLASRRPGVWATLPRLGGTEGVEPPLGAALRPRAQGRVARGGEPVEPLLAHYDFRARSLLETLAAGGTFAPSLLAAFPRVITPAPPAEIARAWRNVNTPDELRRDRRLSF